MRLRIANATLVSSRGQAVADVVCRDGRIEAVGEMSGGSVDEEIDARGLLLFPGFIDPHVHSRDPGLTHKEDFAHSTRAAAAGGVTTLLEMPSAVPPVTSAAIFEERAAQRARVAAVDFGLWGLALGSHNLADIGGLFQAGAVGVTLFWGTGDALELCRAVARSGGLLAAHCEDRGVLDASERQVVMSYADLLAARPDTAESVSIAIAAELSAATGCRFHVVHTASRRGVQVVRRAQADGVRLSAETCPHYLTFDAADFAELGPRMKVHPPIRSPEDRAALWEAVRDGTITSIGSDHAPHTLADNAQALASAPAGPPGVETLGAALIDAMLGGQITPERLAWALSEGTSRLYGLYPRKGALAVGSDADFILVDPAATTLVDQARLHSLQPQTPWHGRTLRGAIRLTILRGEVIARDGESVGPPRGQLVRAHHAPVEAVTNPLSFVAELDEVVTPDVMPVFVVDE